jgi:hypothetical protein
MSKFIVLCLFSCALVGGNVFADSALPNNPFLHPSFWKTLNSETSYSQNGQVQVDHEACNTNFAVFTPVCAASRPQIQFYSGLCNVGLAAAFELVNGEIYLLNHDCSRSSTQPIGRYDENSISFQIQNPSPVNSFSETIRFSAMVKPDRVSATFSADRSAHWIKAGAPVNVHGVTTGSLTLDSNN